MREADVESGPNGNCRVASRKEETEIANRKARLREYGQSVSTT